MRKFLQYILKYFAKEHENAINSFSINGAKTILSANEEIRLDSKVKEQINLIRQNVEDIVKSCKNDSEKLIEYIKATNTKVYRLKYSNKILKLLNEDESFIPNETKLNTLIFNLLVNKTFSFNFEPCFVLPDTKIEPVLLIQQFYKWYSYKSNLGGFDYITRKRFQKYLKKSYSLSKLSIKETLNMQEAVARDKEASEFALHIAHETIGAENVKKKIVDGGAEV